MVKSVIALALLSVPSFAEVKPEGTLLDTYCGENKAAAGERNRVITEVCLARVQGLPGDFVVIKAEDASRKELPLLVLPVVDRKDNPRVKVAAGFKAEILTLGSNGTKKENRYTKYATSEVSLMSQVAPNAQPPLYIPKSLTGKDLKGIAFEVEELSGVVHTESVGE